MVNFRGPDGQIYSHWRDWKQAHPLKHWKAGRSAMLLAQSWGISEGLPWRVKLALDKEPSLAGLDFQDADIEHKTTPPGKGRDSTTDLMVWAKNAQQAVVLGVEGKVSEDFGPLVSDWKAEGGQNRLDRVETMARDLGLNPSNIDPLRYQLIHRTWSAWKNAKDKNYPTAVMLVHSFLPADQHADNHFPDFAAFAAHLGVSKATIQPDTPFLVAQPSGIHLWLCWVSDAGGVVE